MKSSRNSQRTNRNEFLTLNAPQLTTAATTTTTTSCPQRMNDTNYFGFNESHLWPFRFIFNSKLSILRLQFDSNRSQIITNQKNNFIGKMEIERNKSLMHVQIMFLLFSFSSALCVRMIDARSFINYRHNSFCLPIRHATIDDNFIN